MDKIQEWLEGTLNWVINLFFPVAWLRTELAKNLELTSFSLFEQEWYNQLFSETYGWLIIGMLVLPAVLGLIMVITMRIIRRFGSIVKDMVAVILYWLMLTLGLSGIFWGLNFIQERVKAVTGSDIDTWLKVLTPEFTSTAGNAISSVFYTIVLFPSWLFVVLNQYFVPIFVTLLLVAVAIRSLSANWTQNFFKYVVGFGFGALLAKPIYTLLLAFSYQIVKDNPYPVARAIVGWFTLFIALAACIAMLLLGRTVAVRTMDGSDANVTGDVTSEVRNEVSVDADFQLDTASMFSAIAGTQVGNRNDSRLAIAQSTGILDAVSNSSAVQALARVDTIQNANTLLEAIPPELVATAGTALGYPQVGAINDARHEIMSRIDQQPPPD